MAYFITQNSRTEETSRDFSRNNVKALHMGVTGESPKASRLHHREMWGKITKNAVFAAGGVVELQLSLCLNIHHAQKV